MPGPDVSQVSHSSEDSCPTDSEIDTTTEEHRLIQIAQVLYKREEVTVVIKGYFQGYGDRDSQVEFRQRYPGEAPTSLHQLFEMVHAKIVSSSTTYGSSRCPGSLLWTVKPFTAESLNITVVKKGLGIIVSYVPKELKGLPLESWPEVYAFDLADGLQIAFGAIAQVPDACLMQYMVNLTSPWDGVQYGQPWQVFLCAKPWRRSDTGELVVPAAPTHPDDTDPHAFNPIVPRNAAKPCTFAVPSRDKDIARTLKCGRDNDWPLFVTCASTLDGTNSPSLTYQLSWDECENTTTWFWNRFVENLMADGLEGLPVASRLSVPWRYSCVVEDYSIRVILFERTGEGEFVLTPEDDGIPCFLLYGPRATIKMRCENVAVSNQFLTMFYR
jgi:hypothetical protein